MSDVNMFRMSGRPGYRVTGLSVRYERKKSDGDYGNAGASQYFQADVETDDYVGVGNRLYAEARSMVLQRIAYEEKVEEFTTWISRHSHYTEHIDDIDAKLKEIRSDDQFLSYDKTKLVKRYEKALGRLREEAEEAEARKTFYRELLTELVEEAKATNFDLEDVNEMLAGMVSWQALPEWLIKQFGYSRPYQDDPVSYLRTLDIKYWVDRAYRLGPDKLPF